MLIGALAVAMGLQTATARRLAVPDLPTTVVTQTLTGLVADSRLFGGPGTGTVRRGSAVCSMLLGAMSRGAALEGEPRGGAGRGRGLVLLIQGVYLSAARR